LSASLKNRFFPQRTRRHIWTAQAQVSGFNST
jgi:hypothetical protein